MLVAAGTGVATYARALRTAQQTLSRQALLLGAGDPSASDSPQTGADRWRRRLRAVLPSSTHATVAADGFIRHDLFRLGQAFFTVHGRLLPVRVPGSSGIMHWSYPVPLRIVGWRNLYTIHDAIPLVRPDLSPINGGRHRHLLHRIARDADMLVTVSRSAADEIATSLGLAADRLVDCSQPVAVTAPGDTGPLPAGLQTGRYLLMCGTVEPRKNIARVAAAYRASGAGIPLVIAGPDGWHSDMIAKELDATPGVVRLPYQSRHSMVALLARARALLMPSLAEGFGLPVAEAMMLGTPVVTSRAGALAETAGDAALLVDPLDIEAIAEAIIAIVRDDALYHVLSQAGLVQARRFNASSFTRRLHDLYSRWAHHG